MTPRIWKAARWRSREKTYSRISKFATSHAIEKAVNIMRAKIIMVILPKTALSSAYMTRKLVTNQSFLSFPNARPDGICQKIKNDNPISGFDRVQCICGADQHSTDYC